MQTYPPPEPPCPLPELDELVLPADVELTVLIPPPPDASVSSPQLQPEAITAIAANPAPHRASLSMCSYFSLR
jgi:hypothetical protein